METDVVGWRPYWILEVVLSSERDEEVNEKEDEGGGGI